MSTDARPRAGFQCAATSTVTATVGIGIFPIGVGVDPATNSIYVANLGGTVSVIRRPGHHRGDGH